MIHVEVAKLYPGAVTPGFSESRRDDKTLHLTYTSERKLCRLAEGLIDGAAKHYGDDYVLTHSPCYNEGRSLWTADLAQLGPRHGCL